MKKLLITLAVFGPLFLFGCGSSCDEDPPDSYKGAPRSGCSGSDDVKCCSYDGISCNENGCWGCDYILCNTKKDVDCTGWELESWYCP